VPGNALPWEIEDCGLVFETRVTRLGNFSPTGYFFPLGIFLKITKVAPYFGLLFSTENVVYYILQKNGLDFILGDFFASTSGHPGRDA
jgi:hypothetical protein